MAPEPVAAFPVAPPPAALAHVTFVSAPGKVSRSDAPATAVCPVLLARIVYVITWPTVTTAGAPARATLRSTGGSVRVPSEPAYRSSGECPANAPNAPGLGDVALVAPLSSGSTR